MILSIIIIAILIIISGVLSGAEIALSSANRNKVSMLADKGDKRAAKLLATMDEPNNFFATTQLYITFIAFFSGAYAAKEFTAPCVSLLHDIGLPVSESVTETIVFILITVVLTYFALVFGELVPKRIAMQHSIRFALSILPVLKVFSIIAFPIVKFLSASAKLILKILRIKEETHEEHATREELRLIVDNSSEYGHIAKSEHGLILNVFKIDKLTAGDICTHRLDVVALPIDADSQAISDILANEFYTRLPVYEESLDKICGVLYTKDILRHLANNPDLSDFDIKSMMREVHFAFHSTRIDDLFQKMRKDRTFMSVVVDEHGGTMGIVTMEDLIEQIVGNIRDEYDD